MSKSIENHHPRFKVVRPHVEGCRAVQCVREGTWDTPLWRPNEPVRYLDALGRRTRYALGPRRWLVLRCNTARRDEPGLNCDAEILVREDVLFTSIVPPLTGANE